VTVSNPRTRHPAAAAAALAAVNELAPGRVVFGVGSGDSALKNIGLLPGKVADVEQYALAVKDLCAGRNIQWQGANVVMQWADFDLPVWISAEGPRMQHLAGQIASGVLLSNALDRSVFERALVNIAAGAESVGRSIDEIEVWCLAAMCFADSEEEGIHRLRSLLAGTANHVYRFHLDGKEVPAEYQGPLLELKDGYDYRHHGSPASAEKNAQLVERLGLVKFLAGRSVIAGPPRRCLDRLEELEEIGVRNLLVHHHANEPEEFMRIFRSEITPNLSLSGRK
jgi:5,10-methylenetetrahydromethanopterin reductase